MLQQPSFFSLIIKVSSYRLMFSTLGGSVNPRFAGTQSYNPLSSLQSITQLYVTAVLGIASCMRLSLNLIPPSSVVESECPSLIQRLMTLEPDLFFTAI